MSLMLSQPPPPLTLLYLGGRGPPVFPRKPITADAKMPLERDVDSGNGLHDDFS